MHILLDFPYTQYFVYIIQILPNNKHILYSIANSSYCCMSTKQNKKQQNLFHLFIQSADKLPAESAIFPYFQFMDQSIRKIFNQLKKIKQKKQKQLAYFQQFWDQLDADDKVSLYINWTKLLNIALQLEPQSVTLEDQIYIKKTAIFNKWQKKNVRLTPTQFIILSSTNKHKQFDLKDYQIRKSRSRQNFAWVLQPISNNTKYLQCGVSSQTMFDQWFGALKTNVNNRRVMHFLGLIKIQRQNPGSVNKKNNQIKNQQKIRKQKLSKLDNKTLTQRMIDQQMVPTQNDNQSDAEYKDEFQDFQQQQQEQDNKQQKQNIKSNKNFTLQTNISSNPNIFKKLIPQYNSIMNFADTPTNSYLLHCDNDYRIYQLPAKQGEQLPTLKYFTVLPYPKSLIFQAIGSQSMAWNQQIDLLTVKTKISSQNTVLLYQKNKSQGILYRQRDFLYLRHCFSIENLKQKNTFMVDKSIDSIYHPPFMSVVRAQKQLIWALLQKQSGKQCILIVQGWIKGGGYMNPAQNKDMTFKYMKKLNNLNGFLKQLSIISQDSINLLFKQDWIVDMSHEDQAQRKKSVLSQQKSQKSKQQDSSQKGENKNLHKTEQQKQLAQFMIRTQQQLQNQQLKKSQVFFSDQRIQSEYYKPPAFNKQKFVIIPQQFLKFYHSIVPKDKPKKSKYFPNYRGHHLWKGEWQILLVGGLAYVDAEKMQQQKKVLTYIIKRIGKNIFSGKGILNISLPVDIFSLQSNIERLASSFGYFPHYLEKASQIKEPQIQLKYVISSGMASSLIYLTIQKPFNPILGQTYQCWIDDCPIYLQQISHHPPIAAFLMKGRGYTVSGCVQAKMDLSINSGTGNNEGIFKIQFDNGNNFYYTTAAGCLTGLTYGDRKLILVGKSFYWSDKGLFLQLNYNPASKTKGFFGSAKGQGDEKLADYFQGYLKQYSPQAIKQICFKKSEFRQIPIIPKTAPNMEPIKTHYKVHGRWNKYIMCGDQKVFDVDENRYYMGADQKYPLPSHSNYRQDIVYRRLKNFVVSQQFKQVLEIRQRQDRKLRARNSKIQSNGH